MRCKLGHPVASLNHAWPRLAARRRRGSFYVVIQGRLLFLVNLDCLRLVECHYRR